MPGWLLLFPLLGDNLAASAGRSRWPKAWAWASVGVLAVVAVAAGFDADTGALGADFPKLFKRGDPTQESIEWTQVRDELHRRGALAGAPLIVATQWNDAGKLGEALGDRAEVIAFTPDPREFGLRGGPALVGRDALIIGRLSALQRRAPELAGYFQSTTWAAPIVVGRDGHAEIVLGVIQAHRLVRPYPQPAFARP